MTLEKEYKPVSFFDLQDGDIFTWEGLPERMYIMIDKTLQSNGQCLAHYNDNIFPTWFEFASVSHSVKIFIYKGHIDLKSLKL